MKKFSVRDLIFSVLILLILAAIVYGLMEMDNGPSIEHYSEVHDLFQQQLVDTVLVRDNTLILELKEPVGGSYTVSYDLYSFELFYQDFNDTIVRQHNAGIISYFDYPPSFRTPWWWSLVPWVVVIAIFAALW